jgi:hypothetical protein
MDSVKLRFDKAGRFSAASLSSAIDPNSRVKHHNNGYIHDKYAVSKDPRFRLNVSCGKIDENGSLPYKPRQLSAMARFLPGRLIWAEGGPYRAGQPQRA